MIQQYVVDLVAPGGNDALRTERDSYADSPVVGTNAKILWRSGKCVNLLGFIDKLGDYENIPVVYASLAYDDPCTG